MRSSAILSWRALRPHRGGANRPTTHAMSSICGHGGRGTRLLIGPWKVRGRGRSIACKHRAAAQRCASSGPAAQVPLPDTLGRQREQDAGQAGGGRRRLGRAGQGRGPSRACHSSHLAACRPDQRADQRVHGALVALHSKRRAVVWVLRVGGARDRARGAAGLEGCGLAKLPLLLPMPHSLPARHHRQCRTCPHPGCHARLCPCPSLFPPWSLPCLGVLVCPPRQLVCHVLGSVPQRRLVRQPQALGAAGRREELRRVSQRQEGQGEAEVLKRSTKSRGGLAGVRRQRGCSPCPLKLTPGTRPRLPDRRPARVADAAHPTACQTGLCLPATLGEQALQPEPH